MALATLKAVLTPALSQGYAVAGLVVLGWEDALAYVQAAERLRCPVILQAGPGCRAHTPLPVLAAMFRQLADHADVPVVAHLDHGRTLDECWQALDVGFSSVMYDGSRAPLSGNIAETAAVVRRAQAYGVSVEGELGAVGYSGAADGAPTDPQQAQVFCRETGVDALAVAVGNRHLQTEPIAVIDRDRLGRIAALTAGVPLVLHGGSGVPVATRRELARDTAVCKFNIGTELRRHFGAALRARLAADPNVFDRNAILQPLLPGMVAATERVLQALCPTGVAGERHA